MHARLIASAVLGVWLLAASSALAQPASSQPPQADAERIAAARELMSVSGAAEQFDQVMPMMMGAMSKSFEALKPERAAEIREVMTEGAKRFLARKNELIDTIALLYANALALEDLKEITAFYKSPAGTRFKQAMPGIVQQSLLAGQRWGATIGREIEQEMRRELKKRGIDL